MMPREWRQTTLGNIVVNGDGLQTGPFGAQLHASDYVSNGIPVVMPKDIFSGKITTDTIARIPEHLAAELTRHRVVPGDILFGRRGDIGRCGLVTESERGWLCGTGCLRARVATNMASPRFLLHALTWTPTVQWLTENAVGQTMLNLNTSILGKVPLALPPLPEQRKIAAILSSVDDAIEATQSVIEQLQVVKKAMMAELLTRGLPGRHTRFKQTEIGEVPEGWQITQLRACAERITDGTHQSPKFTETGVPFLLVKSISSGHVKWSDTNFVSDETYADLTRNWRPKQGDVLYTAVGATYGVAVDVDFDKPFTFQRHIAHIRPGTSLRSGFLAHALNSPIGRQQADKAAVGNAQPTVTLKSLGQFILPVPPLNEQQEIEMAINSVVQRLGVEVAKLTALNELKSALSSALLTGEIRVQPDEASP